MKRKVLPKVVLVALAACTVLSGCAVYPNSQKEASVSEPAADFSEPAEQTAEAEDILLGIDLTHPDDADNTVRATVCMLFVKQDGTVFSTEYCNDKGYDFFKKKSQRDPDVWNQMEPAKELGKLTEDESCRLAEVVAAIDPNSESCVSSEEDEPTADVEETYHLTYTFYLPQQTNLFTALSYGEQKGISIRSEDPNAAQAIQIIEDTELFQQWLQSNL